MQVNNNILTYGQQEPEPQTKPQNDTEKPDVLKVTDLIKFDFAALVERDQKVIETELTEKYEPKKITSLLLSESYARIGDVSDRRSFIRKSERVRDCGSFLQFKGQQLTNANFCKDRLCPMCTWRKSLKIYGEMSAVMDLVDKESHFIFLTLTVRNVTGDQLSDYITELFAGYKRLMLRKEMKKAVKGWFRAIEVTYNPDTGYHPHFHVVLQVNKNYFGKNYIKHSDFIRLWREAMKLDYDPNVHVEKVDETRIENAVAEAAKYTVKDNDYIYPNDPIATDEIVEVLNLSLKGRRLIAYGGELKKLHKQVETENENLRSDVQGAIFTYHWRVGYGYQRR